MKVSAALVPVEDVNTRLEAFIHEHKLANTSFASDGERQDVLSTELRENNTELREKIGVIETKLAAL